MKYILGMSGGVDSSVSVALLKGMKNEVVGCTLKIFDSSQMDRAIKDAQNVAKFLGIRHEVLDCVDIFKKYVIDYFINSYRNGLTPNPCIICNENVKFKYLENFRRKENADFLATGHYVNISRYEDTIELRSATDSKKDQSYFLYAVDRKILLRAKFPLGKYKKSEIRKIAKEYGIPVADKKDSQDICFIHNNDYASFLCKCLACDHCSCRGNIINENGKILGEHKGIFYYTVGQRKGLGLAGGPFFVKELSPKENTVMVTDKNGIMVETIALTNVKFLNEEFLGDCLVKYRSSGEKTQATVVKNTSQYIVKLKKPAYGVAKGQHCVFYNDDSVIGGGVIQ